MHGVICTPVQMVRSNNWLNNGIKTLEPFADGNELFLSYTGGWSTPKVKEHTKEYEQRTHHDRISW